jgi:hypothetical protein
MAQPAHGLHDLLNGGSILPLEHGDDLRGLRVGDGGEGSLFLLFPPGAHESRLRAPSAGRASPSARWR